jgi:hypothetical protein
MEIGTTIWQLPVQQDFSFSQATNSSEITVSEMESSGGTSRRGRKMFNDSLAPAEWSFNTYMRPNMGENRGSAVEEALWAAMCAHEGVTYNSSTKNWSDSLTRTTDEVNTPQNSELTIDFQESNRSSLMTFNLYFVMGGCGTSSNNFAAGDATTIYKIRDCVVGSVSADFDIDGIAMLAWSGFGAKITEEATLDAGSAISTGSAATDNFIRNRLTQLVIAREDVAQTYDLTLTGGSISIENNITFLTPDTLCKVDEPIGHVTGTRNVSGSFTCYLSSTTTPVNESGDLWEDLIEASSVVTNNFNLNFKVGGTTANQPRVEFAMSDCHLEIPSHSIDDIISLEVNFHALPSNLDTADEITVKYIGYEQP